MSLRALLSYSGIDLLAAAPRRLIFVFFSLSMSDMRKPGE